MAELIKDRYEFNAGVKFSQGQQLWCKIPARRLYSLPNSAHGDVSGEIICRRLNGIAELCESKPNLRPVVSDSAALPPQVLPDFNNGQN